MAEDYTDYITQGAIARGLDPRAALRTVDTEGGRSGKVGDSGTSFGPFQMHVGGTAPGTTAKGLGDAMLAQGLDPKNPYQSIDFALDYAKAHGGTFSPDIWHGLRSGGGLAPGEHRWVGAPSGGGSQPLYLGTLEKNFHDTGNDLLDALLAQNYPKEDKPTGNGLLDQIMQQAVYGLGPPNQAQPAPDAAAALRQQQPLALPPETVPELSGQQVDIKPMQPLQQAPMRLAGSLHGFGGGDQTGKGPPGELGEALKHLPGTLPPGGFDMFSPQPLVRPQPLWMVPRGTPANEAATGNGLLDRILKQLSPISTAQAAEPPPAPQPVPATPVAPLPVTPAPAPPQPPAAVPPSQFIEPPAKGQQVPPPVQPRATLATPQTPVQAAVPPARVSPPHLTLPSEMLAGQPESGVAKFGEATAESIGQLLDLFLKQPLEAGARGISGQDEPGTPQAIEDAMAGAQLASAGSIGRGGMGAGPRLPERIEPSLPGIFEGLLPEGFELRRTGDMFSIAKKGDDPNYHWGVGRNAREAIENFKNAHPEIMQGHLSLEAFDKLTGYPNPANTSREAPSEPLALNQPEGSPPATPPGAPLDQAEGQTETAQPPIKPPPPGETAPPAPLTPPPDGNGPVIEPPTLPDGKKLKVTRQKVQDDLNWTVRSRYADAIEAKQFIDSLPPEFQDPNFRAGVGRDIERRLGDPTVELKPATRAFLDLPQVKALTDEEHALGLELRKLLPPGQADQLGVESGYRTVEEGHVHRMVEGRQLQGEILPDVDPITGRPRGLGGRSLSRNASGMKRRSDHFVGQDDQGNRVWSKRSLSETMPAVPRGYTRFYSDGQGGWTPDRDVIRQRHPTGTTTLYTDFPTTQAGQFRVGDSYNLPDARRNAKLAPPEKYGDRYQVGHNTYTAREPTMTEMEANLPIRYRDDYLLGLVNNVNRMRAVVRNLDVLNKMKPKLESEGLWVPRAEKYLHSPPVGTDARGQSVRFERVNLPQLDGWAHPRIANTINDFAKGFEDQNLLEKINNVLIGSMFVLPFGHIRNVGAHYVIGRGLDWAYRNPQLLRSFNEVWNLGPVYQRFIRENGPAMYPGAADVHGKLVEKLLHDMANDEGWEITAKALGTSMAKLLPAIYNWSARTLWFTNDHLFLARTLENLKRLGQADPMTAPSQAWQQAIAHTKREIPPYEIPDQILRSRGLQRMLTSPVFAFGRYTYDKYRILGENVKEMMGHYGKGMPQVEGAAKALLTLMLAFPVTSALNAALQQVTGNKNARVYGAGPTTIARTVGTGLGRLAGVDPKSALGWTLGMTPGEADFSHALSGILTFSPALDMVVKLFGGGHDPYTGQPMIGQHATPMGRTAQGLEALLGAFYPGEIALNALRQGPGALAEPLGVNLAGSRQPSGKGIRMQRGFEHGREKRDPFQQLLRRGVGAVERAVQ